MISRLHREHIKATAVLTYRAEAIRQGLDSCDAGQDARV